MFLKGKECQLFKNAQKKNQAQIDLIMARWTYIVPR
jgi:hypothetical protein